jgi:hypothetical protein
VRLDYPDGELQISAASGEVDQFAQLRAASFHPSPSDARDCKVSVHRLTAVDRAEPIPATLEASSGEGVRRIDLGASDGQALVPIEGGDFQVTVTFPRQSKLTIDIPI